MTATTPLTYGKVSAFFVQTTQLLPRATIVIPIIPPTQECVVDTGIPKLDAAASSSMRAAQAGTSARRAVRVRAARPLVHEGGRGRFIFCSRDMSALQLAQAAPKAGRLRG